jgi:hypothetical protein
MPFRTVTSDDSSILWVTAGAVLLLVLGLFVIQPSPWVYFGVIWLIPLALGLASLSIPDHSVTSGSRRSPGRE